jgi:hypothetical protein
LSTKRLSFTSAASVKPVPRQEEEDPDHGRRTIPPPSPTAAIAASASTFPAVTSSPKFTATPIPLLRPPSLNRVTSSSQAPSLKHPSSLNQATSRAEQRPPPPIKPIDSKSHESEERAVAASTATSGDVVMVKNEGLIWFVRHEMHLLPSLFFNSAVPTDTLGTFI